MGSSSAGGTMTGSFNSDKSRDGFSAGPMGGLSEDSPEKFGCQAGANGDAHTTFSAVERLSTADFISEENLYQRSSAGRAGRKSKR